MAAYTKLVTVSNADYNGTGYDIKSEKGIEGWRGPREGLCAVK